MDRNQNQTTEVFFKEAYFNENVNCIVPAYWGFRNYNGILHCHETKAEANQAFADEALVAMGVH